MTPQTKSHLIDGTLLAAFGATLLIYITRSWPYVLTFAIGLYLWVMTLL